MISVQTAKELISNNKIQMQKIEIELRAAIGFASAQDIMAPIDFPSFPQSAMDGYAIRFQDLQKKSPLRIIGEVQAGNTAAQTVVQAGETMRIFTGAKMPNGADTVVMQEKVIVEKDSITILDEQLAFAANVRPIASQTKKGNIVVQKGQNITPASCALLAGLGITKLSVFAKPKIIILNTGKELVQPGLPILDGQIYESNSYALQAALQQLHISPIETNWVDDDPIDIKNSLSHAIENADIILVTGGVSVGDYDFVHDALQALGVEKILHKIKQKPGKPLYVGKKNNSLIFGLPGNPASVLTCFYMYVLPAIRHCMGFASTELLSIPLPALHPIHKNVGLTHFMKASITAHGVLALDHQESYKMNSYANANALIELNEETTTIAINDLVKVYLLP
jgi:molybdopterin molybdotransferase